MLPANYTFTSTDAGVHTFTATLNTAGTQSITATDKNNSSITGSESGITVSTVLEILVVSGFPSSIIAGTAGNYTVTAEDAFNKTATGYAGTVSFSSDARTSSTVLRRMRRPAGVGTSS